MWFDYPVRFEIPDAVWLASGAPVGGALGGQYRFTCYVDQDGNAFEDISVKLIRMEDVQPPRRDEGLQLLHAARLLPLLVAMVKGHQVPAVLGQPTRPGSSHPIELCDGTHRFYACAALGMSHLPVAVRSRFEW